MTNDMRNRVYAVVAAVTLLVFGGSARPKLLFWVRGSCPSAWLQLIRPTLCPRFRPRFERFRTKGAKEIALQTVPGEVPDVAVERKLGENTDASFAFGLEVENLSRCGGCTRTAVEQVFKPEQLKATYYNPKDTLINKDPRMRAALRKYADEMREAGFEYHHPDEVETDIRDRLYAITGGGTVPVEKLSPEQVAALKKLQDFELRVAAISFDLQEDLFEPVEEQIEKEMFAREVK